MKEEEEEEEGGRRESEIDRLRFPQTIPAGAAGHTDGAGFVGIVVQCRSRGLRSRILFLAPNRSF